METNYFYVISALTLCLISLIAFFRLRLRDFRGLQKEHQSAVHDASHSS